MQPFGTMSRLLSLAQTDFGMTASGCVKTAEPPDASARISVHVLPLVCARSPAITHGVTSPSVGMVVASVETTLLSAKASPVAAEGQGVSPGRKQRRMAG